MVINGTPIDDQFVITEFYVAGAGRIVYFAGIERLEVNSAGGKDDIYVLSSPAEMEITVMTNWSSIGVPLMTIVSVP